MRYRYRIVQACSATVCGAGIGWLAGLSVTSGVGQMLISTLLGVGVGVATGFRATTGDETPNRTPARRVNLLPVALLVIGVAGGTTLGILARAKWAESVPASVETSDLPVETRDTLSERARLPVLHSTLGDACESLAYSAQYEDDEMFRKKLADSFPKTAKSAEEMADISQFRSVVVLLCESTSHGK